MNILFEIEKKDLEEVKKLLLNDDIVSRGSIQFREARGLGLKKKNYYCYVSGTEEVCKKAKMLVEKLAKIIEGKNKDKIIEKIKGEEKEAMEGFGAIFG